MPTLKRLCPGRCGRLIAAPTIRCPACQRIRDAAPKGNTTERGYGAAWQRLAKRVVARDPVCTLCHRRPSTEADHIVPKVRGGRDELTNLRGTCKSCNSGRRP